MKFYPIFWCGSLLYDKNWRFQGLYEVELFDNMVDPFMKEEAIAVDQLEDTNKKNEQKWTKKI